jgi:hypothetical protein
MTLVRFQRLAADARICVADGFASPEEIAAILAAAGPAHLYDPTDDETGLAFELPLAADPVLGALSRRLAAALGVENALGETFRFRRYGPGQFHPPHLDCYEVGGLRLVATAMLWLVADAEGGETRFGRVRPAAARLAPVRGRLAVWENYLGDTPDPASEHEGLPVVAGEKTTLTSFVYAPAGQGPSLARRLTPATAAPPGVTFER